MRRQKPAPGIAKRKSQRERRRRKRARADICDAICRWQDLWDEETEGPMSDSEICRDCPVCSTVFASRFSKFFPSYAVIV